MDNELYDVKVGRILICVRGFDEALKMLNTESWRYVERWGEFPSVGIRKFPYNSHS